METLKFILLAPLLLLAQGIVLIYCIFDRDFRFYYFCNLRSLYKETERVFRNRNTKKPSFEDVKGIYNDKTFTREEIKAMAHKEFLKAEIEILKQLAEGKIK
jgi:hypothetical protein